MADVQTQKGYIKIASRLAEALALVNLNSYESRVLWVIFRKTYGWNKRQDRISLTQFMKATRLDRRNIQRTLKSLLSKHLIDTHSTKLGHVYSFKKDFEQWVINGKRIKLASVYKDAPLASIKTPHLASIKTPTIDTITIDNIQKTREAFNNKFLETHGI